MRAGPWSYPARPLLRPGARVARRDDGHLQVGLDRELALVLPDTEQVRAILTALARGQAPSQTTLAEARVRDQLLARGLVVDGDALMRGIPGEEVRRHAVSAVHAEVGLAAPELLNRRRGVAVEVSGPAEAAGFARYLLAVSGLRTSDGPFDSALLVTLGEPAREDSDDLLRAGTPHLFLACIDGFVRLGPFVVPGMTACLRCVDAHHTDADPRHPVVVRQLAGGTGPIRHDGVPEPVDPPVLAAALAWAARDLVTYADGGRPETWSATVRFGPGMRQTRSEWLRHARCGCAWDVLTAG